MHELYQHCGYSTLHGAGVDVVFDPVGGPAFAEALKCVRWGAHILVIGFAGGIPKIPVRHVLLRISTRHACGVANVLRSIAPTLSGLRRLTSSW